MQTFCQRPIAPSDVHEKLEGDQPHHVGQSIRQLRMLMNDLWQQLLGAFADALELLGGHAVDVHQLHLSREVLCRRTVIIGLGRDSNATARTGRHAEVLRIAQ